MPAALLTLTPKCLLCLAAYAGLGAALGLGGPEKCGASAGSPGLWASLPEWLGVAVGLGLGAVGAIGARKHRCKIRSGLE